MRQKRAASTKGGVVLLKIIEHHDPQHWQSVEEIILQEARDEAQEKADFYKKGFWICFVYVLWDTLHGFGWL